MKRDPQPNNLTDTDLEELAMRVNWNYITVLATLKSVCQQAQSGSPASPSRSDESATNRELASCPFCGCAAAIHEDWRMFRGNPGYRVECEGDCHAMTCWWHTLGQAIDNWNRRAALPICDTPTEQPTLEGLPAADLRSLVSQEENK